MAENPRNLMSDRQWRAIQQGVAGRHGHPGRSGEDNRKFVDAVLWILRTGAPWRNLPGYFGRWNSVYQRFSRWAKRGVWLRIWRCVRGERGEQLTPQDCQIASLDSTCIKVHQHGACPRARRDAEFVGTSRCGKTTKLHVLVYQEQARFVPLAATVSAGHKADILFAQRTVLASRQRVHAVAADRGYDADAFRLFLRERAIRPVIPTRRNRRKQVVLEKKRYAQRNVVERLFARLKQFRRFASRFERHARHWQSVCQIAFIRSFLGAVA